MRRVARHLTLPVNPSPDGRFIYVTEKDISIDDGPGINEREFISALRKISPGGVECILPFPARPENHYDPSLQYVDGYASDAWKYSRFLIAAYRRISRLVNEAPTAGLVFRIGATPILPYASSRSTGVPLIFKTLALHSIFGDSSTRGRIKNAVSKMFERMYSSVISSACVADTVSEPYSEWINHKFGLARERIAVIPNAANVAAFTPGSQADARKRLGLDRYKHIIGYVGAMSRIRHVDLLIRATRELRKAEVALVLVGGGSERSSLEEEARQLGVSDNVLFVGTVPYKDVPIYMRSFDVGIDLTGVEMRIADRVELASYSQKIPQYLACGVPVVAWKCTDTEFIDSEDVGATARFRDQADLIRTLRRVLFEHTEATARATRARIVAERSFSTLRLAERRVELWRTAIERHRAGRVGNTGDTALPARSVGMEHRDSLGAQASDAS